MKPALMPSTPLRRFVVAGLSFTLCLGALSMFSACTIDSADTVIRDVNADVSGVYRYDADQCSNDGRFVTANSGSQVIYLDVRQAGDQLEAIDNNGIIFRGTIGNVVDSTVSFNLEGSTTAGSSVIISGTIEIGSGQGVMRATWIEDNFFATLCGSANGPAITDDGSTSTNTITNVFFRALSPETTPEELAAYRRLALWFMES